MARVTVEDCVDKVDNRFDLILLSAHRARMIAAGAPLAVDRDRDKNTVVALREIADEKLQPDDLKEDLIHSLQRYVEVDEPEPAPAPEEAKPAQPGPDMSFERMSEAELLRGLEGLVPPPEKRED